MKGKADPGPRTEPVAPPNYIVLVNGRKIDCAELRGQLAQHAKLEERRAKLKGDYQSFWNTLDAKGFDRSTFKQAIKLMAKYPTADQLDMFQSNVDDYLVGMGYRQGQAMAPEARERLKQVAEEGKDKIEKTMDAMRAAGDGAGDSQPTAAPAAGEADDFETTDIRPPHLKANEASKLN